MNRFVLGAWWLFCLIISSFFSATLISSMAAVKPKIPFTSIQQLVNQHIYAWGFQEDTDTYFYAQRAEKNSPWFQFWSGTRRFLQNNRDSRNASLDFEMRKVKGGNYVYVAPQFVLDRELANDCNLTFFGTGLRSSLSVILFWKGSPYTHIFSKEIVRLHENGVIVRMNRKWTSKKRHCPHKRKLGYQLDLPKLGIIFKLLMIGICVAVFLLILEIVWNRFTVTRTPTRLSLKL